MYACCMKIEPPKSEKVQVPHKGKGCSICSGVVRQDFVWERGTLIVPFLSWKISHVTLFLSIQSLESAWSSANHGTLLAPFWERKKTNTTSEQCQFWRQRRTFMALNENNLSPLEQHTWISTEETGVCQKLQSLQYYSFSSSASWAE